MTKIYLVAGEVSGDVHGGGLMRSLRQRSTDLIFSGLGGNKMCTVEGTENMRNWVEEAGVVGLWEVLKKYRYFRAQFDRTLAEIDVWRPDAVILIDYPGFNLRLAKALRQRSPGVKIIYFISPQVWAWNRRRIPEMAKMLDLMLCIFPFEKQLYQASGLHTEFVGHPIIDNLGPERGEFEREENLVGLFPGSREREVSKHFPDMLRAAVLAKEKMPETRFAAAAASVSMARLMRKQVEASPLLGGVDCEILRKRTHELMQRATCAVVASGTATLEAAFFGLPYCLIYKVAWPTYLVGRLLIKVEHLGMVNILAKKRLVKEFLQGEATPEYISNEILRLLNSSETREELQSEMSGALEQLGGQGAYERAAEAVMKAVFPAR